MAAQETVIVFRPEPGCSETLRALHARGFRGVGSPALFKRRLKSQTPEMDGVAVVAVTSEAAAEAAANLARTHDLPLYAVGARTAEALIQAGATSVVEAGGDGAALAAVIAERRAPSDGCVLHVGGVDVRPDLRDGLQAEGFDCRHHPVYDVRSADRLMGAAVSVLRSGRRVSGAIVTSPRVASAADRLIVQGGFGDKRSAMTAFAMSEGVAAALDRKAWKEIRRPDRPNMDALLDLLSAGR